MAGVPLSPEEENYVRMSLLLNGISPRAVRSLFDYEFVPSSLGVSLKQDKEILVGLKEKRIINQSQWNLIYPKPPDVPDSKSFDIILMIILLRNLTPMAAPFAGFDQRPRVEEKTPGADLSRIKWYRNYLAHLDDSKIKTAFFNTAWDDITGAVDRLGGNAMKVECEQLKNKTLDKTSEETKRCVDEFKELNESWKRLTQDKVPWTVRAKMNRILEKWKDKDKKFVNTRAANHVLQSLKDNSCVTITASSGAGKTATLQHVALQMYADEYDILLITDPSDIVNFHNPNKKTLFVIDDLCGNFSINLNDINIWEPIIEHIRKLLEDSQTKIIVACSSQVYKNDKFDILSVFKSCVCNLLSENMCLLKSEKQSIAEIYLEDKASQITKFYDWYDCFPLLCQLYHKNPVVDDINCFFKDPFSCYEKQIEQLRRDRFYGKYCALALCVVFNNKVPEDVFTEKIDDETRKIIENTRQACKLDSGTDRIILNDEFNSLLFTFLKKGEQMNEATENLTIARKKHCFYTTIHEKIFDILSHFFGQNFINCLIQNAHSQVIQERFLLHRKDDIDQLITIVPSKYHQMYIQRMIDDWSKGQLQEVFGNINMRIPQFRQQFLYHLKELDMSSQKKLVLTLDVGDTTTFNNREKRKVVCDTVLLQCCSIGDVEMIDWCCTHDIDINRCDSDGRSPLMYACRYNHRDAVTLLIKKQADYNKCNKWDQSPIMIACIRGNIDLVRTLLDNGADYNKCDTSQKPPLLVACENGHTEIIRLLIENVAELHKGKTCALALCVMFNNKVNELILTKNIDEGTRTIIENTCEACGLNRGTSRLFLMAELDSLTPAFLMIEKEESDYKIQVNVDHFPYFYKTINNRIFEFLVYHFGQKKLDCLIKNADSCLIREKFLLEQKDDMDHTITIVPSKYHQMYMQRMIDDWSKGKLYDVFNNINMKMHHFRQKFMRYLKTLKTCYQKQLAHTLESYHMDNPCNSVILYCCLTGDIALFQWCYSYGVDVNRCNNYTQSPVLMASLRGNTEIVQSLLEKGANYIICDVYGYTPFLIAIKHGHTEIVKMLLDKGIDSNVLFSCGRTLVQMACFYRHTEIVRMLIDKGADFNQNNRVGCAPICMASKRGYKAIVRLLLKNGVDCNTCDISGYSALMLAIKHGHTEIVKIMLDNGADCKSCNNLGESLVFIACRYGRTDILQVLIDNGADYDKCNNCGFSPVMIACEYGHTETVVILLDRELDYDQCGNFGQSLLYTACRFGHVKLAKMLLNRGADYDKFDMFRNSPVMMACGYGHTETVRMLIDKGVDYDQCDCYGRSPLMRACEHGNTKIVIMLLEIEGDYNTCGSLGQSPLLMAVQFGHKILVKRLLENGADYNKCDNWSQSPVLFGSAFGHIEIVKMLLDMGADYDKCDMYGRSPVMLAYRHSNTQIVRMLVDIGANYNACGSSCESPVFMACEQGHREILKMLLDRGEDCNKGGVLGMTPLELACRNGNIEIVKMLLDNGADCNKYDERMHTGNSPLIEALDKKHTEIAILLIDKGADCNKSDNTFITPLMKACIKGHTEIVRIMLDKGANYNKCGSQGMSPIMSACESGHTEIVKLLLDKGADCHKCGPFNQSTVMMACSKGCTEIVRMLLDKGVDCDKCEIQFGCVPLMIASTNNYTEIVRLLIDKGADCNKTNHLLCTPLINACSNGHTEIVKMLLENGADYDRCGGRKESPMMLACERGHTEIVKLLLDKGADCNKRDLYGESPLTTASKKGHDDIVALINKHCTKKIEPDIFFFFFFFFFF